MWGDFPTTVMTQAKLEDVVPMKISQVQKDRHPMNSLIMWNLPKWSPEAEREWLSPEAGWGRKVGRKEETWWFLS